MPAALSPVEAYERLRAAENDGEDARENLALARKLVRQGAGTLAEIVDSFEAVLRSEGANNTSDVQEVIRVAGLLAAGSGYTMGTALAEYSRIRKVENDAGDAALAMQLAIKAANRTGAPMRGALDTIVALTKLNGARATTDTLGAFEVMFESAEAAGLPMARMLKAYKQIRTADNGTEDAAEGLAAVSAAHRRLGGSFEGHLRRYIRFLRISGAKQTSEVIEAYHQVNRGARKLGVSADSVGREFTRLLRAENSSSDAAGNLRLVVNAAVRNGKDLSDMVTEFVKLQELEGGARATSDARAAFELLFLS